MSDVELDNTNNEQKLESAVPSRESAANPVAETQVSRGLSDADKQRLKRAQKRNFIVALILGILLAILGYFAGQNLRATKQDTSFSISTPANFSISSPAAVCVPAVVTQSCQI